MPRQPEKPRRVQLNFSVPVIFLKEDDTFVAYTPALDLSTCGDTFEDAQTMFAEAVTIFLKELLKMGTLEEVLLECGWQKVTRPRTRWIPPVIVGQSQQEVNIQIAV
jgi:predicted RNase H-like HicB family nuclease